MHAERRVECRRGLVGHETGDVAARARGFLGGGDRLPDVAGPVGAQHAARPGKDDSAGGAGEVENEPDHAPISTPPDPGVNEKSAELAGSDPPTNREVTALLKPLRETVERVRSTLWFVPATIVLASIGLAIGMIAIDESVGREALAHFPRIFGADAESSRSMLLAIGSSMITVAGVTFSITVLAVAQASSQYTSRVLRNFMSDWHNQVVLGVFVGVFAYSLVVLRTIRGGDEDLLFIPSLSVAGAFLLALVAIGFLIYFIHHIAESLQAATLLARVREETTQVIERLFPEPLGEEAEDVDARELEEREWVTVRARRTGYVQSLDNRELLNVAGRAGVLVRMERGIGEFVVEEEPIASLSGERADDPRLADRVERCFALRPYRTVHQDPAFGVRQIVDVALKALSPSLNDTTTAIICIDHLSALLVRLAARRIEHRVREADGRLRVIARGPTFAGMLDTAFDQIRRSAAEKPGVLQRMIEALIRIGNFATNAARRRELARHVRLIVETAERSVSAPEALADLQDRARRALAALEEPQGR